MTHLRAYAKINLGLRILGKRPDGFHEIDTVFHRIDLYDEIDLGPSDRISLTTEGIAIPPGGENLCLRAAQLLAESRGTRGGARIHLKKNIPIGAGLGGGSADAAVVLAGLSSLWGLNVPERELLHLALQLGSDVPYFLKPGTAAAGGRGERLEYFDLYVPWWIVVVTPDVHVSTAWAYANVKPAQHATEPRLKDTLRQYADDPGHLSSILRNDFESVVAAAFPPVARAGASLRDAGADVVFMSGSGSSMVGFFRTEQKARAGANRLKAFGSVSVTEPHFQPASE